MASFEMAINFVTKNLNLYFGINDITRVIVEGHNQLPDKRESLIEEGIQKAIQIAKTF
jgi:FMN-dependent NADH-azoreductase